jgi:asparagine synthase (glutamine-hydrolysing)
MCRIAGIFDPTNTQLEQDLLRFRDAMHKGGPDDAGIYQDGNLALGHRRLSIIDLSSAGHQPMLSEDANLVLSFNGEIYNYRELRQELVAAGFTFNTQTDTEVLLKAYQQWGTDCFAKLNGMFALAIYDKSKNELVLARDHAGIKPLYYHLQDGKLYFASEIRAFNELGYFTENPDWPIYFLAFGHLPEPITTLQDVQPLPKGSCLTLQLAHGTTTHFSFAKQTYSHELTNEKELLAQVNNTLSQAVERHLVSDAPIGLFLSGGIDSSLLTLLAQPLLKEKLQTLSIVFDETEFSEKKYQDIIIAQTGAQHHTYTVTKNQFLTALPDVLAAMDQPSTDGINSYFICQYAKAAGLTAVLSGLGADELFGGYNSFVHADRVDWLQKIVPSFVFKWAQYLPKDKYQKAAFLAIPGPIGAYLFNRGLLCPKEISKLLAVNEAKIWQLLSKLNDNYQAENSSSNYANLAPFNQASAQETNLYMQNQLLKDSDYMSMWHAVEIRVPFLDRELMQLARKIAPQLKAKQPKKYLLIHAFLNLLPEAIWNRPKMGFTFPFQQWLQGFQFAANTKQISHSARKINNSYAQQQFQKGNYNWSRFWATQLVQEIK